ncbi:phospholipid scramblase 1 isoform X2 [Temnothorax longispinosus]|uniref:phospholipid scramblase 1 isoform X2 n=1 Tax=Temnothorax longispinosus TaxID=300112 RepID=UPI003A9A15E3
MSSQKYDAPYPPLSGVEEMQPPIATAPPPQPNVPMPVLSPGDCPQPSMICPLGLEYLMCLDYLFVDQKKLFEGWTRRDKFLITDNRGEQVFYIEQELRTCWRFCLGQYNSLYEYSAYDRNQQEILHMVRPFAKCCQLPTLEVHFGGTLLGSVTQEWSFLRAKFYIRDAFGQPVLMIKGPSAVLCSDSFFEVKSVDEQHIVGMIRRHWRGFSEEMFNFTDKFGINFPRDLDVKIKAVLLGATILIDCLYFGKNQNR